MARPASVTSGAMMLVLLSVNHANSRCAAYSFIAGLAAKAFVYSPFPSGEKLDFTRTTSAPVLGDIVAAVSRGREIMLRLSY